MNPPNDGGGCGDDVLRKRAVNPEGRPTGAWQPSEGSVLIFERTYGGPQLHLLCRPGSYSRQRPPALQWTAREMSSGREGYHACGATKDRPHVREYTAIRIKLPLRVVTVSLGIGPVSDREIGASLLESLAGDMRKLHEFRRAPSPSLSVFQD